MPDTPSITLVKRFTYRGANEEWSNTYHFTGTTPANDAAWKTLSDAWIAQEKTVLNIGTNIVRVYGYVAGNEHSIYQRDMTIAPDAIVVGTLSGSGGTAMAGDQAACVRWYTGALNSRGKKIYCWKYFHGGYSTNAAPDNVLATQAATMLTYAGKLIDGTLAGDVRYSGPQGAALSQPKVLPFVTTRTLRRRGKRPLASG